MRNGRTSCKTEGKPARGQLNRENENFLIPVHAENLVSRDGFSRVPSRVSPLVIPTQAESGANSRYSSRFPRRRPCIIPSTAIGPVPGLSGHAISYQWRSLPRESAGTGPVVLNQGYSSNGCCLFRCHQEQICMRLSFPTPTINIGMSWTCRVTEANIAKLGEVPFSSGIPKLERC